MLTLESHFHGNSYVKFTWSKVVAAALFIHERQNVEHAQNNIKQSMYNKGTREYSVFHKVLCNRF